MRNLKMSMMVLMLAACATATTGTGRLSAGDRDVLTAAEISQSGGATAYEVIAQLRPEFLRSRGISSLLAATAPTAVVYMDNVQVGGLDVLRTVGAQAISRVEYLSASDATTRFGTDHTGGAILISTKR